MLQAWHYLSLKLITIYALLAQFNTLSLRGFKSFLVYVLGGFLSYTTTSSSLHLQIKIKASHSPEGFPGPHGAYASRRCGVLYNSIVLPTLLRYLTGSIVAQLTMGVDRWIAVMENYVSRFQR